MGVLMWEAEERSQNGEQHARQAFYVAKPPHPKMSYDHGPPPPPPPPPSSDSWVGAAAAGPGGGLTSSSPERHPIVSDNSPDATGDVLDSSLGVLKLPLCAGCRLRIVDKFYLSAVEQKWHASCLKCSECGVELEGQVSCYERNGHIFCKDDYLRIYGHCVRQCSRCLVDIHSSDLVMKARHCLFHVDCFRCATCDIVLRKGDLFGMCDHVLYCKMHFELLTASAAREDPHHQPVFFPHNGAAPVGGGGGGGGAAAAAAFPPFGHPPPPHPPPPDAWFAAGDFAMGGGGPGGGPGGSGGPGGDFPYDNNNEPGALLKKRRGRKKRKVETSFAAMNGFLDSSGAFPPGSGLDPASAAAAGAQGAKTKRARTSFKHHQLRIMKAHFQINQNPDSRELKMLSQKTGLDKKVLQVWFQNARAKWRRTKAQDGGGLGGPPSQGGSGPPSSSSNPNQVAGSIPGGSAGGGGGGNGGGGGGGGTHPAEMGYGEASPSSDGSGAMIPCC